MNRTIKVWNNGPAKQRRVVPAPGAGGGSQSASKIGECGEGLEGAKVQLAGTIILVASKGPRRKIVSSVASHGHAQDLCRLSRVARTGLAFGGPPLLWSGLGSR